MADTREDSLSLEHREARGTPGLIAVFRAGQAMVRAIACGADGHWELGRESLGALVGVDAPEDEQLSRRHARVWHDGQGWHVVDLDSRNGTFVDGARVARGQQVVAGQTVRVGHSIFLLVDDGRPFAAAGDGLLIDDDGVRGPVSGAALERIRRLAGSSETLLVTGETGSGKERAARAFHAAGPHADGPFLAVNAASIPEGVAERLLFGAVKGAFTGATADATGYIVSAHEGTLFLDEIGELEAGVQAKLLRVLETGEVLPLGAVKPRKVSTRFVFATLRNLRTAVQEGRLRPDLYFRLARVVAPLPPLRARREEIPGLVAWALERGPTGAPRVAHARFVEACLVRPWPGNVRELLGAVRDAADAAMARGEKVVRKLADGDAGRALAPAAAAAPPPADSSSSRRRSRTPVPRRQPGEGPSEAEIRAALEAHRGSIAPAARALGLHRTQLYRELERLKITPKK